MVSICCPADFELTLHGAQEQPSDVSTPAYRLLTGDHLRAVAFDGNAHTQKRRHVVPPRPDRASHNAP